MDSYAWRPSEKSLGFCDRDSTDTDLPNDSNLASDELWQRRDKCVDILQQGNRFHVCNRYSADVQHCYTDRPMFVHNRSQLDCQKVLEEVVLDWLDCNTTFCWPIESLEYADEKFSATCKICKDSETYKANKAGQTSQSSQRKASDGFNDVK